MPSLRARYRPKPFLTCRIPNLQFHLLAIDVQCFDLKVHADCGDVVTGECVIGETQQQGTLSNTCNSDYLGICY